METQIKNSGFLLHEGEAPLEYDPNGNFAELSGIFDPQCRYGAYRNLTGDRDIDRYAIVDLLAAMVDYIPVEHLGEVKLIFHPFGTAGTGFLEDGEKSTFGWKYNAYENGQR